MDQETADLRKRALQALAQFLFFLALAVFVSAGSVRFWQGWTFLLAFAASILAITLYFLRHEPRLVEIRLRAGPVAEKETSQKVIQSLASVLFLLLFVVPGLDHRFRWSHVPVPVALAGDLLLILGFAAIFLVMKENRFASSTIEINPDQQLISTGPYRIVRHPMYAGSLLLFLGAPLALGSWWGLLTGVPMLFVLAWRLIEEERFLVLRLPGYSEYRRKTRFRLIPFVW